MGKGGTVYVERTVRKVYSLLKKEAAHENEPQRILFLLRNIMLLLGLYFLIFPLVMCPGKSTDKRVDRICVCSAGSVDLFRNLQAAGTYRRSDVRDTAAGVGCDLYPDVWLGLRHSAPDV